MAKNLNDTIYSNIHYLLARQNIGMSEFENILGISKGYISRIKKGHKNISINICYEIAKYFGISLDDLVSNKFEKMIIQEKIAELKEKLDRLEGEEDE